jgi:FixJ family two-component response regulator
MNNKSDQNKTIHVLSNDTELLNQITRFLRNYATDVKTFRHISKFLDMPLYQAPSCLITSLYAPIDNDGVNLIKQVQSKGLLIPVIVIATESDDVYSAVKAIQAGAADFITRPILEENFLDRVDQVIKKSP